MSTAKDKVVERFIEEISSPADWVAFILGGGLGFCASVLVAGADAGQFAVGGGFVALGFRKATAQLFRRSALSRRGRELLQLVRTVREESLRKSLESRLLQDLELFGRRIIDEAVFEEVLLESIKQYRAAAAAVDKSLDRGSGPAFSNSVRGGFTATIPAVALPDPDEEQGNQEKLNQ